MAKEIYKQKLIQICSNIDEQAIVDACKYIDVNGLPHNRRSMKISFIIFNNKKYPLKYVLEIANNEIKKNQVKLGPQGDYNPINSSESAVEFLFPNPQKFKIATHNNEEGHKVIEEFRKEVLSYAKQYGAKVKNLTKKRKNIFRYEDCEVIEKYTIRYTEIKIGTFVAEVSSIGTEYGGNTFYFDINLAGLNPIHQQWIKKHSYCSPVYGEQQVEQIFRIIEYAAYHISC